jgi:aspartyl-tRNA(Asn)/glutamyl-tRNA(Gln) amidotransferase subunit B
VDAVIAANASVVGEIKGGKAGGIGFLVGQVMKATGGKANPQMVNELLKKKISA